MIAIDPIARIIGELAAAGYEAKRASDMEQPEAVDGFNDGKFQAEGKTEMSVVIADRDSAKNDRKTEALIAYFGDRPHSEEEHRLADSMAELGLQMFEAEQRIQKAAEDFRGRFMTWAVETKGLERGEVVELTISPYASDMERYHRLVNEFHGRA